jgi:hypothetical protein
MSFVLVIVLLAALMSGCGGGEGETTVAVNPLGVTPEMYSAEYWTNLAKDSDKTLAAPEDIALFNAQTAANRGSGVVDLVAYPSELDAAVLRDYLSEYTLPQASLYAADGSTLYELPAPTDSVPSEEDDEEVEEPEPTYLSLISENINAANLEYTNRVSYALTLQNTTLRRFPSSDRAFLSSDVHDEDIFLQAPLWVGEPVIVLHTSLDQTWYFVQVRGARGWVYWSDIVFLEKSAWVSYIEAEDFVVVTDSAITLTAAAANQSRTTLYMGTTLPLFENPPTELNGQSTEGNYVVRVPAKDRFGNLEYRAVLIPRSAGVTQGFLPYSSANVLAQAMKLAGEKLRTRGLSNGWDGGWFFASVFKTFGVYLPYDIAAQRGTAALDTDFADMTAKQRASALSKLAPGTLLYSDSSAFVYLGEEDGVGYVLHPATTFYVGEAKYTANSIIITRMNAVAEGGVAFADAVNVARIYGIEK